MKKVIMIAVCMLLAFSGCAFREEIVIPRAKIQESISSKFPYDKDAVIIRLTVETPEVYFEGKSIGVKLFYHGNFLTKKIKGYADINGKIVYKPETGAFYLHDLTIADITINENNLSDIVNLQQIIDKIISRWMDGFCIYRLDPDDYKQNLARLLVKDIFVRNDDLVVVLGK